MSYTLYIAIILVAGMGGGKLAKKLKLPTVTGYILTGLMLGPSLLNLITTEVYYSLQFANELALSMLAVSVGTELHWRVFRAFGKNLVKLSLGNTFFTAVIVALVTWLLGMPIQYALILGPLAMSVSPSGVVSIIKETKAEGEMTQNLLGLVAFDNLVTILTFGMMVSFVQSMVNDTGASIIMLVGSVVLDILFASLVGIVGGAFVSYFIRKEISNDKLLALLIAALLFNSGVAAYFGLSPILTDMIAGVTITNLTNRKVLVASLLNRIELPIFIIFLTLAGAHLDVAIFGQVGLVGIGYIVARSLGKYAGSFIFSHFTTVSKKVRYNLGYGLIPQAGVAIGLATIAEQSLPNVSGAITGVVLTGVVFFEIFGPLLLEKALVRVDEIPNES
ncbi:Kef-type K+ transport system, membrane component KefB [Alkalibacterium subtropicum]|uniref:Kef-type K+ transport system, membrane component KefB n=1 Tax=Alkalibacterium subtropicum TaxID=753702 RepID=A0A1I1KZ46_9LACT|nr:cation:proton antiporter [Alkalibacterium subtropicum]SFC66076.1 Kef-type K+ transport system, membrane component KefB [Alkalibacterium subtropicum]